MEKPHVTVLLIEDNPRDAQIMQEALLEAKETAFVVEWVDRVSKGLDRLAQGTVDLVLTGLQLPDSNGLQTVTRIREQAKGVPIIVLTSLDDEALAIQALQKGAQDYLVKGYIQVYRNLLVRSIRYAIERSRTEEERTRLEKDFAAAVAAAAVADRKRAAELDEAYQELKRTQAMLVQAEKLAAVGQLASGIAHEVKNPLGIILQCVNYLEPELSAKGGSQAEILQVMREAVKTSDKIIRGLLDFSRPTPLELKSTPILTVINASLALVQAQAHDKKIRLTTDVVPEVPPVMLDEHQMQQVFINLILNAFHAMPQGGALTIRGRVKRLTEARTGIGRRTNDTFQIGETALVCEIHDTGTGIPKEILPNVFNPFFTTKPPGEGVGLGLAITASIIQGHRGIIYIESKEGRGTTVSIILPLSSATPRPGRGDGQD